MASNDVFKEALIKDWTRKCRNIFVLEEFMREYTYAKEVIECFKVAKTKTNNFQVALDPPWMEVKCEYKYGPPDFVILKIHFLKNRNYPSYFVPEKGFQFNFAVVRVYEYFNGAGGRSLHWRMIPIDLLELKDE